MQLSISGVPRELQAPPPDDTAIESVRVLEDQDNSLPKDSLAHVALQHVAQAARERARNSPISHSIFLVASVGLLTLTLVSPSVCVPGTTSNSTDEVGDSASGDPTSEWSRRSPTRTASPPTSH